MSIEPSSSSKGKPARPQSKRDVNRHECLEYALGRPSCRALLLQTTGHTDAAHVPSSLSETHPPSAWSRHAETQHPQQQALLHPFLSLGLLLGFPTLTESFFPPLRTLPGALPNPFPGPITASCSSCHFHRALIRAAR